ncbi:MAG TPA: response regulator [Bacteroidia bacterium]|nr:response regulator [Bacteroidia bacterium]
MKKETKLLLVDDDDVFIFITKKTIDESRLVGEVNVCANGMDAIRFLEKLLPEPEKLPDVILLDLNMPVLDGWGFLAEYETLRKKLPGKIDLYVVSSSVSPHEVERAKSFSYVSDFIVKPVTAETIGLIRERLTRQEGNN